MNGYIPIKTKTKPKKTYLQMILDELKSQNSPIEYQLLSENIQKNWDEEKCFDETYLIKSIIRGIKEEKIKQLRVPNEKNKYKGHIYSSNN